MISESYISIEEAVIKRVELRNKNKKLALTNGCFDLLHTGHVYGLLEASKFADELWVALNTDESIAELKGENRPIVKEIERAYMLSALKCVDQVILFNSKNLKSEILKLRPDYYVKSNDYSMDTINEEEKAALLKVRSVIKFVKILPKKSTTNLISQIINSVNHKTT